MKQNNSFQGQRGVPVPQKDTCFVNKSWKVSTRHEAKKDYAGEGQGHFNLSKEME
jgi:hypothetical protein